jgi:hypothetical protein
MRARDRVSKVGWLLATLLVVAGCSGGASESSVATPSSKEAGTPPSVSTVGAAEPADSRQGLADARPDEATPPRPRAPREPGGDGERLNPEIAGLGTEVMLAAFPERVGAWARGSANAQPAGTAGRWADGASATYRHDGREISVDVTDMIRVNACTPGTGASIQEQSLAGDPDSKRVTLGKHSAVLSSASSGVDAGLWLGNRCQLGLSTSDATADDLVTLGSGLGLDALAAACERRDPVGVLGR